MNQFDTIDAQDEISRLAQETTEEHDTTPSAGDGEGLNTACRCYGCVTQRHACTNAPAYNPAPVTALAAQIRAEVDAELARRESIWTQHTAYLNETE